MHAEIEDWKNGWFGVELGLRADQIDSLIEMLNALKRDPDLHFHLSSNYKGSGGVGDVTIYVKATEEDDDLAIGGPALRPGDSIELED